MGANGQVMISPQYSWKGLKSPRAVARRLGWVAEAEASVFVAATSGSEGSLAA